MITVKCDMSMESVWERYGNLVDSDLFPLSFDLSLALPFNLCDYGIAKILSISYKEW